MKYTVQFVCSGVALHDTPSILMRVDVADAPGILYSNVAMYAGAIPKLDSQLLLFAVVAALSVHDSSPDIVVGSLNASAKNRAWLLAYVVPTSMRTV